MSGTDDGGFAFPHEVELRANEREIHDGMTLLDYFAGQALAGWLTTVDWEDCDDAKADDQHQAAVAKWCYGYAAAMLAERARRAAPREGGGDE